MTTVRTVFFSLIVGVAVAMSGGAEARSGAPWNCESFSAWVEDWDGIVRARVVASAPVPGADPSWARAVTADTIEVMWGRSRPAKVYVFHRARFEMMDGEVVGHLPEAGETVVLMLNHMGGSPDDATVGNLWDARDFDHWAKRCRLY